VASTTTASCIASLSDKKVNGLCKFVCSLSNDPSLKRDAFSTNVDAICLVKRGAAAAVLPLVCSVMLAMLPFGLTGKIL